MASSLFPSNISEEHLQDLIFQALEVKPDKKADEENKRRVKRSVSGDLPLRQKVDEKPRLVKRTTSADADLRSMRKAVVDEKSPNRLKNRPPSAIEYAGTFVVKKPDSHKIIQILETFAEKDDGTAVDYLQYLKNGSSFDEPQKLCRSRRPGVAYNNDYSERTSRQPVVLLIIGHAEQCGCIDSFISLLVLRPQEFACLLDGRKKGFKG